MAPTDDVLLGDPLFPDFARTPRTGACAFPDFEVSSLPATRQEVLSLHALMPSSHVLLGADASEGALLSVRHPRVLHVATHGVYLADQGGAANTRNLVVTHAPSAAVLPTSSRCNPLLRSALLLARGGGQGDDTAFDGVVTALEVSGIDLWGTRMVVLSACESGRGEVRLSEGVYGLRRALLAAGAETLVTSLWPVDDATTRDLMLEFYRGLSRGLARTASLDAAASALRRTHPHPYYWAPFVALGADGPLDAGALAPR